MARHLMVCHTPIVETKKCVLDANIRLKHNGKAMHIHTKKATKLEKETLTVRQLEGSTRLNPPRPKDDFKTIGKLKIKPHHFDKLQRCMRGMGSETL